MWRSIPFRRLVHTGFLVSILLGSFLPGCRDRRTGDHSRNLFLATFHEDQRTDLHRDHVLVFEFSMALDPASVGLDTLQVTTESDAGPVLGLYEVQGNIVRFNPVVDEEDPNRGILPLNPYGFEANTKFRVLIPAASASQTKVLKSAWGLPIGQDFTGGFTTGADFTPCPGDPAPPSPPSMLRCTTPPMHPTLRAIPRERSRTTTTSFPTLLSPASRHRPPTPLPASRTSGPCIRPMSR